METFTLEQLKQFDGKSGKPAYFAFLGMVYDATGNDLWADGDHQGIHSAGTDLTTEIENAPHGAEVLEGLKIVGELQK